MKTYEEMNVIEYWEAVKEYASLLGSLAEGWTETDVMNDMQECIDRGGDGFLETMTGEQLENFAKSVHREIERGR